ncbi:MAG: GGDEF domain-containing protein [Proteobacteria bacterium]|nr:GGDEF domain-containing protein [Pseudomonadota bacterium]
MLINIPKQIKEFGAAVRQPFSYNLGENIYIWFGILWGLPIPLVTILLHVHFLGSKSLEGLMGEVLGSPMQWLFLAHPLLFGVVFGILGTIRNDKENKIKEMVMQLKEMSIHDPLTGLKNRRYFAHIFHDECARSLRRREALTLLFLDLDHFKRVNDNHGHHFGDIALQETSRYLEKQCRPYDTIVRWGGEEFIILLRATDESAAINFSERIRLGIQTELNPDLPFSMTISIGLAQYQDNDSLEDLADRADKALYHAKQTGRNKVIPWSMLSAESNL